MVLTQYLHVCTSYHGKERENKQIFLKKIPKVMSEHRRHLSFRIIRVAILNSKEVESVKHTLERHSPPLQGKRGFPLTKMSILGKRD